MTPPRFERRIIMATKSAGKFYTNVTTAVAANAAIPYATSVTSGAIVPSTARDTIGVTVPGLYYVAVNLTYLATVVGEVGAALYADGAAVPGASAMETLDAVGDAGSLSFATILTVKPSNPGDVAKLQVINTGVASSYAVANVIIYRIA